MFKKKETTDNDMELYLIFDSKVGCYERPNFAINDNDLIRQLLNMFRDPGQAQNKYILNAEDYSVFRVGGLQLKTGTFTLCQLTHVVNLHDLRAQAGPSPQPGIVAT